ncbi:tetratricopeptide repeat protein [Prevotella sp.]|uniref:tetratricopeptide repeat protein n=1 Tax=Prevotella sp. TaxID=59823 RepID=UPI0025EBFABD|nr:tetratricopeptide repeat protein [Prevotella sp.]
MDLVRLIEHPELMNKETLYELRNLVALYPYYQTARLLLLQNMYLLHETSFDDELRRAAIYITDRKTLFNLVEASHYHIKTAAEKIEEEAREAQRSEQSNNRTLSIINEYLESTPKDSQNEDNDTGRKPTPADAAVDYVAYLLKTESQEDKEAEADRPQMKGQDLIDSFINDNGGKIQLQDKPTYKPETEDEEDKQNEQNDYDEGYFTETLAKIYIKQGRYSKALEIIQRLNLNYPKKNAYFADQIRFLRKLILNEKGKKPQEATTDTPSREQEK